MKFQFSADVQEKLKTKHGVDVQEVYECFLNRHGPFFLETRPEHVTDPSSWWFVAETDKGRPLKVIFVRYPDHFAIKSAFDPENGQYEEYEKLRRENEKRERKNS